MMTQPFFISNSEMAIFDYFVDKSSPFYSFSILVGLFWATLKADSSIFSYFFAD
jgi:hypothetical protein